MDSQSNINYLFLFHFTFPHSWNFLFCLIRPLLRKRFYNLFTLRCRWPIKCSMFRCICFLRYWVQESKFELRNVVESTFWVWGTPKIKYRGALGLEHWSSLSSPPDPDFGETSSLQWLPGPLSPLSFLFDSQDGLI